MEFDIRMSRDWMKVEAEETKLLAKKLEDRLKRISLYSNTNKLD